MLKRAFVVMAVVAAVASPAGAQDTPDQARPAPPVRQPAPQPTEAAPPRPEPRPPAQLINVRIELTISDQRGSAAPAVKTVTMVVADRANGRVRSGGEAKGMLDTVRPIHL